MITKYGVVTPVKYLKCPRCGATTEDHGDVHKCPVHGTLPFELEPAYVRTHDDSKEPE